MRVTAAESSFGVAVSDLKVFAASCHSLQCERSLSYLSAGNFMSELRIACTPHFAHAAFAER